MSRRYSSSSVIASYSGMALEEHEQALSLLHEGVDAGVLRPRQHAIAARAAAPPPESRSTANAASADGPARRRSADDRRRARTRTRRTACRRAAAARCRRGGECRRGRPGRRGWSSTCGRSAHSSNARQAAPVRLVRQVGGLRLRAGDDEAVVPAVPEIVDAANSGSPAAGRTRSAGPPAASRASAGRRDRRPPRPSSARNCRSVASSAASGMLLTSPMSSIRIGFANAPGVDAALARSNVATR